MRTAWILAALAAAAGMACPGARAGALDDFLAFTSATRTATARFEQQVFDRNGKAIERASGRLSFSRPGKFRWAYETPQKQLLVGDGERLWIHDPDLNQVTVKRLDKAFSSTPAALLAGQEDVTKVFTLREAAASGGLGWVEATPKAKDTGFENVRIGMKGRTLAAMELTDSLGGRTRLDYTQLVANPSIAPQEFRFVPPPGADVLEDK